MHYFLGLATGAVAAIIVLMLMARRHNAKRMTSKEESVPDDEIVFLKEVVMMRTKMFARCMMNPKQGADTYHRAMMILAETGVPFVRLKLKGEEDGSDLQEKEHDV